MKVFWAVLLVLIVGSVAYLAMGRGSSSRGNSGSELASAPVAAPPRTRSGPDNNESAFFASAGEAGGNATHAPAGAAAPSPAGQKPSEVKDESIAAAPQPGPEPEPDREPESLPDPVAEKVKEAKQADVPSQEPEEKPAVAAPDAAATPAAPPPPPSPQPSADSGTGVTFGADAKIVKNDDGSMMVDDKYQVKGEGTEANPYEITWEYLVSAQEDYQPRLGKKKLPGRLKLIDNKRVKITGFVAFPIMAEEPTEMLAMLNQWDGCCIGIPPTPYDAVEVKLSEPASNEQRLVTFGTVEGKLSVEPYLVRDWLVSLYSLDDATMSRAQ